MKRLLKDCKRTDFKGMYARRHLKLFGLASVIMLIVAALCFTTGTDAGSVIGLVFAAAPVAAFKLPEDADFSENEKKGLQYLADYIDSQLNAFKEGQKTEEEYLKSITDKLKEQGFDADKIDKLEKAMKKQGADIVAMKEKPGNAGDNLKEQLKTFLTSDDFKSSIKEKKVTGIEIKAATTIMTPNASTNAPHALRFEIISGIQSAPRELNAIFPALYKGSTGSRTIIWINRVNEEGGAAFIAEGAIKPLKDWEYKEENSVAKKIAVSTKVSTEMLQDFEYMASEINRLLNRDLFEVIDLELLSGTGGTSPTGILTVAGGYVSTGLDGTILMPNNADAIRAGILQLRLLNYTPDVLFINPTDNAALDLTKSSTGNYIRIELDAIIGKLRIIETTRVPVGKFLLMDTSKWDVKVYQDFRLEFGWENDDFRKNLVLVIAEMRIHSYQNSIDAGSVIFEDFATVRTALEKVEAAG